MVDAKISVIVPVYNLEKELPRCLNSILAQTYQNIEVVVVDDGSTDGSRSTLAEFAARDSRVKPVFKENGGVTSARLQGVVEAVGDWIGFVDGDDEIEPDMYERLLANARRYGADITHCGYRMVFADGRVNFFHNSGMLREQNRETAVRDLLEGSLVEPGLCNKLYRRALFADLPRKMDASIRINEDLLMNYYLFSASEKAVFEDWCPYHYIVRGTSASRSKLNEYRIYDPIRVKRIILENAPEELLPDARRAYVNTCINTYHALVFAGEEFVQDLRYIRQILAHEAWSFPLLGRKRKLMANLITRVPMVYKLIYGFYCRFLQRDVYS